MGSKTATRIAAAIDLGSNSFHMVVAASDEAGFKVLDRMKERVFLASGLGQRGALSEDSVERALTCLERFRQRLGDLPRTHVRAVGTNTFRAAKQPHNFLALAEEALGRRIEILSGEEEARLIYRGVRYDLGAEGHLLDIDIGGGSTEIVCGNAMDDAHLAESLSLGSAIWSDRFFADGKISRNRFHRAILEARHQVAPVRKSFLRHGHGRLTASSGTALSMARILKDNEFSDIGITLEGLSALHEDLLRFENLDDLKLVGLKEARRKTFLGGLAILIGVMQELEISTLGTSEGALREGLLQDLLGRLQHQDSRSKTVLAMMQRYAVDEAQAQGVAQTALRLGAAMKEVWGIGEEELRLLQWASQLHEIGLAVRHTGYHRHGAYLVRNSDMPGFSRTESQLLAFLIRNHRNSFHAKEMEELALPDQKRALHMTLILRLATQLHRMRREQPLALEAKALQDGLQLRFPKDWLEQHALTDMDLQREAKIWQNADYTLRFS
ncbi:MAG: Ppx/GppA phosphatase family protein [Planctomycetota bacterium]|nr:Ppx/GppA phosphatase family protein [Planctomycetota bacterium]MDA1114791.1 Ppx/GppA phosphatase family protein [Planctomycetota bacterium]